MTVDDEDDMAPRYATLGQLARYVGVSVRTIQRLRKRGVIPSFVFRRIGKRLIRVDVARFQEWLDNWDGVIRDPAPRQTPEPKSESDGGPGLRLLR